MVAGDIVSRTMKCFRRRRVALSEQVVGPKRRRAGIAKARGHDLPVVDDTPAFLTMVAGQQVREKRSGGRGNATTTSLYYRQKPNVAGTEARGSGKKPKHPP